MHRWWLACATSLCCCLAWPATTLATPQTSLESSARAAPARDTGAHRICFDTIFYRAMPGVTNYCLGLRQWNRGHYDDALVLLKLAAGWGNKSAQYTLGLIYYNGHHVATNPALGLAWLHLADQRHNDAQIQQVMKSAARWVTPAQRKQADELYAQMLGTYGDNVAAARAWHHLRHWERERGTNSGTVCVYGRQAWALNHAGLTGMAPPGIAQAIQSAAQSSGGSAAKGLGGACVGVSFAVQNHIVQKSAQSYFQGWVGTVTVEPLQQVPAPATSVSH